MSLTDNSKMSQEKENPAPFVTEKPNKFWWMELWRCLPVQEKKD
jgi:hypothetical protein